MSKKYEQIAEELRRRISQGVYQEGQILPQQIALAEEFDVSRMTLKKTMDILAMEGLLFRKRGVGTFVHKSTLWNTSSYKANEYRGLTVQLPDKKVESKIISFDIQFPSEELQKILLINSNEAVYHIVRLRIVDHKPYLLEDTYYVVEIVKNLKEEIIYESIYEYIRTVLELKIGGAYRKISADLPTKLDIEKLEANQNTPILEVEQVVYLTNGVPFEYSKSRSRYDMRSYTITDIVPH